MAKININDLTSRQLKDLLDACDFYLGARLGLEGAVKNPKAQITIPSLDVSWPNPDEFAKAVQEITSQKDDLKRAYAILYEKWEQKLAEEKSGKAEKTTLTKEELKTLEEEAEKQKAQRREAATKSQADVQQFVDQQQKIAKEVREAQKTLKDKKIYVKVSQPKPIKLTPKEQKAYKKLQNLAQKTPHILIEDLTKIIETKIPKEIQINIKPEEIHYYSEFISVNVVNNLRAGPVAVNKEPIILASLANRPEVVSKVVPGKAEQRLITRASSDQAVIKMLPYRATREILIDIFGENVPDLILGPDPTQLTVTFLDNSEGATDIIPLDHLVSNYQAVVESPLFEKIQSLTTRPEVEVRIPTGTIKRAFLDISKEKLLSQIEKLPADSFFGKLTASSQFSGIINLLKPSQAFEATNLFGNLVLKISPDFTPIVSGLGRLIGIDFGIVPAATAIAPTVIPIAGVAVESTLATTGAATIPTSVIPVAAKTGARLLAKTGLSAVFAKVGAALGSFAPIVGNIIGAIVGWLVGKLIEPAIQGIKKHNEDVKILGIVVLGGGILVQSLPLLTIGSLITISALSTGSRGLAGIRGRVSLLGRIIGQGLIITIGTPIIIAIVVFPILIVIILFIINSGAYLVPPRSGGLNFESPYIKVDKVANPSGPFQNINLPLTIEYTITITAKKGVLTNIQFKEDCQVIKRVASVNCPPIGGSIPQPPASISPTAPFSFKYSVEYAAGTFADSLVVNNFAVTADTPEAKGVRGVGSASIKVGNPPEDCPNNAWPIESGGGLNLVTQGPSSPLGCSHHHLDNAIDIGVNGATVVAVHSGIVAVGDDSCVGKYVKVSSTCGSVPFLSLYAHLGAISVNTGQRVSVGQALGINNNTGSCTTGAHLHFEFKTSGSIPKVQKPYLVRDIPIGCCSISTCNP